MTRKIRVLIVDDSTLIRRMLTHALTLDNDIEVAGSAPNGKIALAKIPLVSPDVITLDMEMPVMDGIATLIEIKKLYPQIPVIMFSALTERGAHATFDALSRGASDYVTKPGNVGSATEAIQSVHRELAPRVKTFCAWYSKSKTHRIERITGQPTSIPRTRPRSEDPPQFEVLAIGVSTGGPNALTSVLPTLPKNFPLPILIVQHMPPVFTRQLAERLNSACKIEVREAQAGDILTPGTALIAPGGDHMRVRRKGINVVVERTQDPPENFCRPAVDVLFRDLDTVFGAQVLATVLTGMGRDGFQGARLIHQSGGFILAQDEATSVVWGMPGAVVEGQLADRVLPLDRIGEEIIRLTAQSKYPVVRTEARQLV